MALKTVVKTVSDKLLLGRCVPCIHRRTAKVQVPIQELDEYILMYFSKNLTFYASDPKGVTKTGDIVLIKKLPEIRQNNVTHEVVEVAYPLGDVTDPVTGEKCAGIISRAYMQRETELYGKLDTSFDFVKAPKRGWQAGKRDYTDKYTYVKYHEFNENEEEFNDPYAL